MSDICRPAWHANENSMIVRELDEYSRYRGFSKHEHMSSVAERGYASQTHFHAVAAFRELSDWVFLFGHASAVRRGRDRGPIRVCGIPCHAVMQEPLFDRWEPPPCWWGWTGSVRRRGRRKCVKRCSHAPDATISAPIEFGGKWAATGRLALK